MDNPISEDRRQFSRIEFDAAVVINQDGKMYHAQLVDVSLNGVLVTTPNDYQIRTDMPCTVRIQLTEDAVIVMQVTLVHSGSQVLGFHCTSIDMDSIVHLRRLIEVNLADTSASDRVLGELLKRHKTA